MKQVDLFRPYLNPAVAERVARVLSYDANGRAYIGQGPLVDQFEREFATLVGAPDVDAVVSTNSCTSALGIALQLAGVGPGDEVISSPMTCTATSGAIVNRGARIIWADVSPRSGLIAPADVARKLTPRTRAIVAIDWAGHGCDYTALRSHGIPVIEDAAHALLTCKLGTDRRMQSVARLGGEYVCYSLGPIKHLSSGDGGMLITHRGDAERARLLRWHGLSRRTKADFRCEQPIREAGTKAHMTDINAAIGLANIADATWVVGKHREHAAHYDRALAGLPGVVLPPADPGSSWWIYPLLVDERDAFMAFLAERGIQSSRVHARNDTHHAYYFPNGPLPGVDHYDDRIAAIPVGWWLDGNDLARVVEAVREWPDERDRRLAGVRR
jgi:dTDP-4-amino-4,6-dideoxygalactose transaminase